MWIVPAHDELIDGELTFNSIGEPLSIDQFALEGSEEALAQRVVVAVADDPIEGCASSCSDTRRTAWRRPSREYSCAPFMTPGPQSLKSQAELERFTVSLRALWCGPLVQPSESFPRVVQVRKIRVKSIGRLGEILQCSRSCSDVPPIAVTATERVQK